MEQRIIQLDHIFITKGDRHLLLKDISEYCWIFKQFVQYKILWRKRGERNPAINPQMYSQVTLGQEILTLSSKHFLASFFLIS